MKKKGKTYLSELVRKLIDDYPDLKGNRTRAKILLKQYPNHFKDLESARSAVRFVTGKMGQQNIIRIGDIDEYKKYIEYPPLPKEAVAPPLVNNGAVKLDHDRMVFWNDLHGPWFDMDAINWALKNSDADTLYINGDLSDFYWLSRFLKENTNITFDNELESIKTFLKWISDKFDNIYYKLSNHEDRLPHYLVSKAPEISKLKELQAENLLNLKEYNIKVVGTHQHAEIGDLDVIHGHEIRVNGSVNLAQSIARAWQGYKGRMNVKVLAAHHHIVNQGVINNPDGSKAYGWVNGCLCQRAVGYSPKNRWQHSIAHATQTSKGTEVEILVK